MKASEIFIVVCSLFVWPLLTHGQASGKIVRLPAHKIFPMRDSLGKVLWTKITNYSAFPDTLYPQYNGKPGSENKYRNDQSLINWVIAQVPERVLKSNDTDKIKLALIYASAPLTKGETKLSTCNFFDENKCDKPDSAFVRKYSLIGSQMGVFHDHCGDEVRYQQELLLATGYFKPTDFLTCTLGWHTTCAVLYKGDTIAVDFAHNKAFLLIKNRARKSGFASPYDLHNDSLLITADQVYWYVNDFGDTVKKELRPGMLTRYRETYGFKKPQLKKVGRTNLETYKVENMWVLPPHSSIEWADTFYYVIDSTGSETIRAALSAAMGKEEEYARMKLMKRMAIYIDSVNQAAIKPVADILGVDFKKAEDIFLNDKLILYNPSATWRPLLAMTVPRLHVSVTSGKDFIIFGKDAYFGAGFVTGQHIKNEYTDTKISYNLWDNKIMTRPIVRAYKQVIYPVDNEIFVPPASSMDLYFSYNPGIIDFYNGPSFWVSNPAGLLIEASADAVGGKK